MGIVKDGGAALKLPVSTPAGLRHGATAKQLSRSHCVNIGHCWLPLSMPALKQLTWKA